jgi:hypothetical protein
MTCARGGTTPRQGTPGRDFDREHPEAADSLNALRSPPAVGSEDSRPIGQAHHRGSAPAKESGETALARVAGRLADLFPLRLAANAAVPADDLLVQTAQG